MSWNESRSTASTRMAAMLVLTSLLGCGSSETSGLIGKLKSSDVAERRAAARRLGEIVPAKPGASGALIVALDDADEEVRRWSAQGLGAIGAISSQYTLEAKLKDPSVAVRRASAFALQKLAPDSTAYRAELISAIKSGEGGVIVSLARLEPPPTWAMPALLETLKDRRPGIRRLAAEALGQIALYDPAVRTALEKARNDTDDRVREAAGNALLGKRTS